MGIKSFFKNAFSDMKTDAKAQHEVDKAEFNAARAESKAQFAEAKAMGRPETRKKIMQKEREERIAAANERCAEADARTEAAKREKAE